MNMEEEVAITIKIPAKVLEFVEFYATICNEDKNMLLGKILVEKLIEVKRKMKEIPHISQVVWEEWNV